MVSKISEETGFLTGFYRDFTGIYALFEQDYVLDLVIKCV